MKRFGLVVAVAGAVLAGGLAWGKTALAEQVWSSEQQIVVTGIVPDRRVIVVDASGKVQQIFSNTHKEVVPEVHLGSYGGPSLSPSPTVARVYSQVMGQLASNHIAEINLVDDGLGNLAPRYFGAGQVEVFRVQPVMNRNFTDTRSYLVYAQ